MESVQSKRVLVIATDGFEYSELTEPVKALEKAGAKITIAAPKKGPIEGWSDGDWADEVEATKSLSEIKSEEYDCLFIPGGTLNCDKLRMEKDVVEIVSKFFEEGKPIAAICHGPQLLIEANVVQGRKVTSYKAVSTDLKNAGAHWEDSEVVVDQGIVTSRSPADLPAFIKKMIEEFGEGIHGRSNPESVGEVRTS